MACWAVSGNFIPAFTELLQQTPLRAISSSFPLAHRMIHVIVLTFLTPAGRKAAAKVLRDVAASMHRRL